MSFSVTDGSRPGSYSPHSFWRSPYWVRARALQKKTAL